VLDCFVVWRSNLILLHLFSNFEELVDFLELFEREIDLEILLALRVVQQHVPLIYIMIMRRIVLTEELVKLNCCHEKESWFDTNGFSYQSLH
jgi:hypothetical protein